MEPRKDVAIGSIGVLINLLYFGSEMWLDGFQGIIKNLFLAPTEGIIILTLVPIFMMVGHLFNELGKHRDHLEEMVGERTLELRRSEEKYSTLVEKGNDGIIIIQDGLLRFVNSTMAELTGFTVEEATGRPFLDFISPAFREFTIEMYQARLAGEEVPSKYEIDIISKEDLVIPVEVSASLIEYNGKPADMAIIRDMTDRKRLEDENLKAKDKIIEGMERHRAYVFEVADRLRNPLQVLKGSLEEINIKGQSPGERKKFIKNIHDSTKDIEKWLKKLT